MQLDLVCEETTCGSKGYRRVVKALRSDGLRMRGGLLGGGWEALFDGDVRINVVGVVSPHRDDGASTAVLLNQILDTDAFGVRCSLLPHPSPMNPDPLRHL